MAVPNPRKAERAIRQAELMPRMAERKGAASELLTESERRTLHLIPPQEEAEG